MVSMGAQFPVEKTLQIVLPARTLMSPRRLATTSDFNFVWIKDF